MNGWNAAGGSDTGDGLAYAQYGEHEIPNYWQYARHFVLGDHFLRECAGAQLARSHVHGGGAGRLGDGQSAQPPQPPLVLPQRLCL